MINRGIWVGLVAIAFVAGSIMTGAMAYAASNSQGQPFQQLQNQIDEIKNKIGIGPDNFTVDSFFDVFYDIELSSFSCPAGEVPKVNEDLKTKTCVPETTLAPDSFFDVFYDIELHTQQNTDDIGTIQTEIIPLQLHSADPTLHLRQDCTDGEVLKWDEATLRWVCAQDTTGSGSDADSDPTNELQTWSTLPGIPSGFLDGVDNVGSVESLNLYVTRDSTTCAVGTTGVCSVVADCDGDDIAISGGFFLDNNALERSLRVGKNFPYGLPQPSGWAVEFVNEHPSADMVMFAYAVCSRVP